MLQPVYLAGFTGHRTGFDEAVLRPALREALEDLARRALGAGGRLELHASVAEGGDVVCVEVARELGLAVHLLLPLSEEEFARDFSSPAAWERSERQLELARRRPGRDSVTVAAGRGIRPECYFDQGVQMLDMIDVLIAMWDGQPSRGLGGTAEIVAQARRMGIPVLHIEPGFGRTSADAGIAKKFEPDPIIKELNTIASETEGGCAKPAADAKGLQDCLDQIAVDEAARFRPSLAWIIGLHGIAALLAATLTFNVEGVGTAWKWPVTVVELILVSVACVLNLRHRRRHTQQRWIRCRFACEVARGIRATVPLADPLHPDIARDAPAWRRFALTVGLLARADQPELDAAQLRDHYIATRLSDTHSDGQIRHYRKMNPAAHRRWKIAGKAATWAASLAPVFVALAVLNKGSKHLPIDRPWELDKKAYTWPFVVFLPIALPLIAGVANSLRHSLDAGRRNERYPQMAARLLELRASLEGLSTEHTIRAAMARSEALLMSELLEWQFAMQKTGR